MLPLLLACVARAAELTLALPPGVPRSEWQAPLAHAGLGLAEAGAHGTVELRAGEPWVLVVAVAGGTTKTVAVATPTHPSDREDIALLAASLARSLGAPDPGWALAREGVPTHPPSVATPSRADAPRPAPLPRSRAIREPAPLVATAPPPVASVPPLVATVATVATDTPPVAAAPPRVATVATPGLVVATPMPPAAVATAAPPGAHLERPAPPRIRPWAEAGAGVSLRLDLPASATGSFSGGVDVGALRVGLTGSAETARAIAGLDQPAEATDTEAGVRVGWAPHAPVSPSVCLEGAAAWRHFAAEDGTERRVVLPVAGLVVSGRVHVGSFLEVGPVVRASFDLANVTVGEGGEPRLSLSPLRLDAGLVLAARAR